MEIKQKLRLIEPKKSVVAYEPVLGPGKKVCTVMYIYRAVLPDTPPTEIEMTLTFPDGGV